MMKGALKVSEIYQSICSSGKFIGQTCTVVRLFGGPHADRNDRHPYASIAGKTKAEKEAAVKEMTYKEVLDAVMHLGGRSILVIAGGDPMLQQEAVAQFIDVYQTSLGRKATVVIETNGQTVPSKNIPKEGVSFLIRLPLSNIAAQTSASATFATRINLDAVSKTLKAWECSFVFDMKDLSEWKEIEEIFAMIDRIMKKKGTYSIWLSPIGNTFIALKSSAPGIYRLAKSKNVGFALDVQSVLFSNERSV